MIIFLPFLSILIGWKEFSIELVWSCKKNVQLWETSANIEHDFDIEAINCTRFLSLTDQSAYILWTAKAFTLQKEKSLWYFLTFSIYIVQVGYYCFIVIKFLLAVWKSLAYSGFALPENSKKNSAMLRFLFSLLSSSVFKFSNSRTAK